MSRMKFTIRDLLWLTVVTALVVALIFTKRPIHPGRYQLVDGAKGRHVVDTTTGRIWWQRRPDEWIELPSPPLSKP